MQCKKLNTKTPYVGRSSAMLAPGYNFLSVMGRSMSSKQNKKASDGQGKFGTRKSSWDFQKGAWFAYSGDGFPGIAQGWLVTADPGGTGEAGARVRKSSRALGSARCISSPWLPPPSSFS